VVAVSPLEMERDDARLQQLSRDLSRVQSERQAVSARIERYTESKAVVTRQLKLLQQTEAGLEERIAENQGATLNRLVERVKTSQELVANLGEQGHQLRTLRDSAAALDELIDSYLGLVQRLEETAQRLAEASNRSLARMVKQLLSPNPNMAAARYLERQTISQVAKVFRAQGLPASFAGEFAKAFVSGRKANIEEIRGAFIKELTQELGAGPRS
jgi:predicted nuclease with TOPRIM domain